MANRSPIEQVVQGWTKRAQQAQKAGIPFSTVKQIAKPDIQKVLAGGSGMSNLQANLAIASATKGGAIVAPPKRGTGFFDIIGNIPSDFGDVIHGLVPWNLAKGLYNEGQAIRHAVDTGETSIKTGEIRNIGDAIRQISEVPGIRLVPGVHTLGGLTTSEGRKELERHPLMTAIDVGIPAGKATKLALAGKEVTPGSALEAASQGHLIRAASRATGVSRKAGELAKVIGTSSDIREGIARPYAQTQRRYSAALSKIQEEKIRQHFDGLTPEQTVELVDAAKYYHPDSLDILPEMKVKVEEIRPLLNEFSEKNILEIAGVGEGSGPPTVRIPRGDGTDAIYSPDSLVARTYKRKVLTETIVSKRREQVANARASLEAAETKVVERSSKPRRFMEPIEQHELRSPGETSAQSILNAAAPLIESFRELNPAQVYQQIPAAVTKTNARGIRMALRKLAWKNVSTTEEGLFGKFADALNEGKYRDASKYLRQIKHVLNYSSLEGIPSIQRIKAYVEELTPELLRLRSREGAYAAATRMVERKQAQLTRAESKLSATEEVLSQRSNKFTEALLNNPEARFIPLVERMVREGAMDIARRYLVGEGLENAVVQIRNSTSFQDFKKAFEGIDGEPIKAAEKAFEEMVTEVKRSWLELAEQGYDPLWVHNTPINRLEYGLGTVRPLPDHLYTPGVWRDRVLSFAPGVQSVGVAITEAARQLLQNEATKEFITTHVMPFTSKMSDLKAEYFEKMTGQKIDPLSSLPAEVEKAINKDYSPFDPSAYFEAYKGRIGKDETLMLPKHIDRSLKLLLEKDHLPIKGFYNRSMGMYKMAVLTGPRHVAHVAFGGLAFMLGREPRAIFRLKDAYDIWKRGEMDPRLSKGIDFHSTDQIVNIAIGKQLGKWWKEIPGDAVKRLGRFEEAISDMYRIATQLSHEKRGFSVEEAIRQANKTLVDIDGMTPVERVILKQVFPFYTFTSHLLRYVLTYPADHPLRTAILSRLAQQELDEWNTGLPESMMNLLWIGKPDEEGNVKAVDIKSTNPFRSLENIFTLAGFTTSLNPYAQSILSASGVNTLQAVPELYPEVSYNPQTGSLQAKRTDVVPKIIGTFVPVSGAIDHFIGASSRMRRLKKSNPDAYRSFLFSQLNLPFTPYLGQPGTAAKKNIKKEVARTELNRLDIAQKAASAAIRSGDTSGLSNFETVPYYGEFVPPELIEQLLNSPGLSNLPKEISPRAVIPSGMRRKARRG